MAYNISDIISLGQQFSAPSRRALSNELKKVLLESRYEENPNVAAMKEREALKGYGEGLSEAITSGQTTGLNVDLAYKNLDLQKEQLALTQEQIENQQDAATISGLTQLGLLGLTGYDIYKKYSDAGTAISSLSSAELIPATETASDVIAGSNVASLANELAISGVTGDVLTSSAVATQTGAPATLGADYAAISGIGEESAAAVAGTEAATEAGTTTIAGITGSTAGAVGVAAGAAVFAYGTYDFWSHWGEKTGLTAIEWTNALKSGNFDTTGGYGGLTWNQWLSNYQKGLTTNNPTSQLAAMTGMSLQESYDFGKEYGIPGFENLSSPTQYELEKEASIAAQRWETLYGGG